MIKKGREEDEAKREQELEKNKMGERGRIVSPSPLSPHPPLPLFPPRLLVYHYVASRGLVMADCIRDMGLIFHLAFITFSSHQSAGSLEVRAIWHAAGLPLK